MNCINNIAVSNDKKNRTRSILIILAILLSTMLLTIIAIFCYDSIRFNQVNAEKSYGSYYGTYINVDEEKFQEVKLRGEFSDIGLMAYAGKVQSDTDASIYLIDNTARELSNLNDTIAEGNFPIRINEVSAQKSFFSSVGYENCKVGDKITFKSRRNNSSGYVAQSFVISGILKDKIGNADSQSFVYVSKDYYESQFPKEERFYTVLFRLNDSVKVTSDNVEKMLIDLAEKCNISEKQVIANIGYLRWALDPGTQTIAGGIIIGVLVILFTVVVIYNIFQIGIKQKIQEYGKIKAIGATSRQLRGIVLKEGMFLGIIGIPIGLILGCNIAKLCIRWILKHSYTVQNGMDTLKTIDFSIPLLIAILLASFLTIWIAMLRPMKIVSKISPIEAIRYLDNKTNKVNLRKGFHRMGMKELILSSFSINKKGTIMTVFTLGMSCILFMIIVNFVGNIDNEFDARRNVEYGQFEISLNYSLDDKVYTENNLDRVLEKNPLSSTVIAQLKEIEGVTEVKTRDLIAMKIGDQLNSVLVLDKEGFDYLSQGDTGSGILKYESAVKKDAIIYGWSYFTKYYGYDLNQDIMCTMYGDNEEYKYKGVIQGAFGRCDADWAITDETYKKMGMESNVGFVWVNCDIKDINTVEAEIDNLFLNNNQIEIKVYEEVLNVSKSSTRLLQMVCYTLLAVIGMIGFINVVNTMIITSITRKREFGVLQAIGMTNKQLNIILQMEGLIYMFGTVFVTAIGGLPAGYALFLYGKRRGWIGLYEYHFPWIELVVMIIVLCAMQVTLSFILSRNIRKETLVERIRYQE